MPLARPPRSVWTGRLLAALSGLALAIALAGVRDAANPLRLNPAYNAGDHIHLNDAGATAVADAIPLSLFH